jgi:hypothetical protein
MSFAVHASMIALTTSSLAPVTTLRFRAKVPHRQAGVCLGEGHPIRGAVVGKFNVGKSAAEANRDRIIRSIPRGLVPGRGVRQRNEALRGDLRRVVAGDPRNPGLLITLQGDQPGQDRAARAPPQTSICELAFRAWTRAALRASSVAPTDALTITEAIADDLRLQLRRGVEFTPLNPAAHLDVHRFLSREWARGLDGSHHDGAGRGDRAQRAGAGLAWPAFPSARPGPPGRREGR